MSQKCPERRAWFVEKARAMGRVEMAMSWASRRGKRGCLPLLILSRCVTLAKGRQGWLRRPGRIAPVAPHLVHTMTSCTRPCVRVR